jgi:hypothetical protein
MFHSLPAKSRLPAESLAKFILKDIPFRFAERAQTADKPGFANRIDLLEMECALFKKWLWDNQFPSVALQAGGVVDNGEERQFVVCGFIR